MACLHDHSCEDHNCAADWSLYNHVDIPKVLRVPSFSFPPSPVARLVRCPRLLAPLCPASS